MVHTVFSPSPARARHAAKARATRRRAWRDMPRLSGRPLDTAASIWLRARSSLSDDGRTMPASALDARGLDERPPLVLLGLVEGAQVLGRLLFGRRDLLPEVG